MSINPYLDELQQNLPRLLALFDTDRTSASYGLGDRYHWAWGLIDFGNGTFQGAANGFARLWQAGLWPYLTKPDIFLGRIGAMFEGAKNLTRRNGSLEEAFPNEGSYCVTALVAFDLLCAFDLLKWETDTQKKKRWQQIIAPMIRYLIKADETHALISNHLATAVAALTRWHQMTQDVQAEQKGRKLLQRILDHQSQEGWFREYDGADPGYQTLCTYYLADIHRVRPNWELLGPLRRSLEFLRYFAHPDGSFGGLYGSRCTRFYYPAGVLELAKDIPEAKVLADFMETSISRQRVVTLSAMDEPNLVPMFNAYCWAAAIRHIRQARPVSTDDLLPSQNPEPMRKHFPQAGILIDHGPRHYTLVNTHKGGVFYHFSVGQPPMIDAGVVVRDRKGRLGSTQGYAPNNPLQIDGNRVEVSARVTVMPRQLPGPGQFLTLRLLSFTLFRIGPLREWIKRGLVHLLIRRRHVWPVTNTRSIQLGQDLTVQDAPALAAGYRLQPNAGSFVPIHMASKGYWQIQDEGDKA